MKTRTLPNFLCLAVFLFLSPSLLKSQTVAIGTGSGYLFYDGSGKTLTQITIKSGTYSGIVLSNVNGTPTAPVVVINSGGQVISTTGADAGLELTTCRYVHVTGTGASGVQYGFKLTGGGTGSFDAHFGCSDIEIDHIECGGSSYGGLMFRTYPSEGCQWSVTGSSAAPASQSQMSNPAWAIYNMIIHDNYIHDVSGEGMYLGQSHYGNAVANAYDPISNPLATSGYPCAGGNESPIIGAKIYNNIVKNVGYDGIQLSGCISGCSITQNTIIGFATVNQDGQDGGITWNPGSVGTIDRNWIQYTGSGVCMGIMYQGQGDTYITNNVIIGGGGGQVGLAMLRNTMPNVTGSTHKNIYIYNNTIAGFGTGYWWYGDNGFASNTFFSNNIVACTADWSIGNGNISTLQKTTNLEVTTTAGPAFVNYAGNDFHLTASSPAAGKGTTQSSVTTDYAGTARSVPYDMGAYTFSTGGSTAPNKIPVANAGADQTITLPVNSVTLSGSASKDSDGTIVTYAWTKIAGPSSGTIVSGNTVSTAVNSLAAGTYSFRLVVTDNSGATNADTVVITVKGAANQSPVANAGADKSITLPVATVTLDGSASTDPDGTIASYAWTKVSGPAGLTISTPATVTTAVNSLIAGTYVFKLTVTDNLGATGSDSITITVKPAVNVPPVANAGNSKSITLPVNSTSLDGTQSTDADGTITAYNWTYVSGPATPTITGGTTATPTVSGMIAGLYTFQLTVTDNSGATASAQVKITVVAAANQAPVASAGADKTINLPTNTVTLNGTGSTDPDGTIASYAWAKVSGPSGSTISTPAASSTAVNALVAGTYIFKLTVTDNQGATGVDSITVTVNPAPNVPPVADAGAGKTITLPVSSTSLDGTKSSDADGTITTYSWSFISGPAAPTITGGTTATPTVSGLLAGLYTFQLTVTDNSGATASAQVKVTVLAPANQAPIASAGADKTITLPTNTVTLDGTGSTDPDGTIASFAWTKVSGPSGSAISSPAASSTSVNALVAGTYVFKLTVTDNQGATGVDSITVTVNPAPNVPPVADAGAGKTITLPVSSTSLDGTKSSDADGTITVYNWTFVSGPATPTITGGSSSTPTVSGLIAGLYTFQLTVTDNSGATASAQVKVTVLAPANQSPIASAGADKTITLPVNTITLDGSGSTDPDGTIASYAWTKVSGSGSTISTPTASSTSVNGLTAGTYIFKLTVTDNLGATGVDSITVTVNPAANIPPVADAGAGKTITLPVSSTSLNGTNSSDADGTITAYSWTFISGPATPTITGGTTATPTVSGLVAGLYTFQLTVTDNSGATASAQVKVTVLAPANQAPVASAGADKTITLPTNTITLDGSGSTDPDGTIASFAWTKVSGPAGSTISTPAATSTPVNGLVAGTYIFKLTVTDNLGATGVDSITITVNPALNVPPVADAGAGKTITLPVNSTSLDGTNSTDADGTITAYSWTFISGPASATITGGTTATPTVSGLIAGLYTFQLTVTDNSGATASAQVKVTVLAPANQSPIASAGADKTITLPVNTITLDGSGSTDPDGTISAYAWTKVSGPGGATISSPAATSTPVNGLVAGTYVYALTVTDNQGATATDSITVTVNPAANIPPVADAGTSKSITLPVSTTSLDGTNSSDADGTITGYAWTFVSGPATPVITGSATATPSVSGLVAGVYTFQLTVTDNAGATGQAQVKITVIAAVAGNPVANAGSNQTITLPTDSVSLDGSGSSPASGSSLTGFGWTQISGPSTATILTPASATTKVYSLIAGVYQFQLVVTDANGNTDTNTVTVTVLPKPNQNPVADAGSSITLTLPVNSATLDGTKSTDPDGTIATYAWTKLAGPAATLTNANTATPDISNLVAGNYIFRLTVTDNQGATDRSQVNVTVIAAANQPPQANAGNNQTITLPVDSVTLDGSASADADGTIANFAWTQVSGPSTALIISGSAAVTKINSLVQGNYVFRLTVTDNKGATSTDQVTITVNPKVNLAPVADAGVSQTLVLPANSTTLDGTASSDADGTIAAYTWTQIFGIAATITNANTATPGISNLAAGNYIFRLTVTDNQGATSQAQVNVTVVSAPNQPPVANAGNNLTITLPVDSVTLDGTASADADGTITLYAWTQVSGPSTASIVSGTASITQIKNLVQGNYVFRLTVTDNKGATSTDQVSVTVNPKINIAPIADAGVSQTLVLPTNSTTLDGTASSDPDGSISGYSWTQVSGATATITNANTATPGISNLAAGNYTFRLTVTDNSGATSVAQVNITVVSAPNQTPVANAGINQTITLPTDSVLVDGSASADPDGTITGYAWTQISGPSTAVIVNAGAAATSIKNLVQGNYIFRLTVTDNSGATSIDQLRITVNPRVNTPPVANAGSGKTITLPTNTTTLDGSLSTDADGTIVSYSWVKISGPADVITGANTATPVLTNLVAGTYTYRLTVTDNDGATAQSQVNILVISAPNQSPVANAGNNLTITLPTDSVQVNGSASADPDGTLAAYAWTQVSGPSVAVISSNASVTTTIKSLVQGTYVFRLTVTDNNGATSTDQVTVTVNPRVNIPPVADAGLSKTITLPVNSTTLDGTNSSDADGTIVTYSWTEISGPAATLTNANTPTASVSGMVAGNYTFRLTVTDNNGATSEAQVNITVVAAPNQSPAANAGNNQTITLPKDSVIVNGSASADPDGTIAGYAWSQISGPSTATIVSNNAVSTSIKNLAQGVYVFRLTVTDNKGATGFDQVTITVNPKVNVPPVADAGLSKTITLPVNSISLDGTNSSDADGTITNYSWTKISGPAATITNGTDATATASALTAGVYTFQLTVTDNNGATASASVKITVLAATNQPPVANAGTDISISLPLNSVKLDGTKSFDPDGNIAGYSWTKISGPASSTIVNATNATPTVTSLQSGTYIFQLTVTDNKGATSTDEVQVTVGGSSNLAPVANAGTDTTVAVPAGLITLNGAASTDPDGTIATYSWTELSGPSTATIDNAGTDIATANNLVPGQYVFTLKVTDNKGATDTAQVVVNVVNNLRAGQLMMLYPNPASSVVNIRMINDTTGTMVINIYDMNGRSVKTFQTTKQQNYYDAPVNISSLSRGVYIMEIILAGKQKMTSKFIKD